MSDCFQIRKAVARESFPLAEGSELRRGDLRSGGWVEIVGALSQPCDERLSGSLARFRGREEDPRQASVSTQMRILEELREARLLEVHDVFAASRRRADEDHPAKHRRPILRDLLRDH